MRPGRRTRLVIALATVIVAVVWLIGCIPVPGLYRNAGDGPRPEALLGNRPSSGKPLAVGRSTRDDVERAFASRGYFVGDDRSTYVRPYSVVAWYVLICGFFPQEQTEPRWLVIRFGPDGRIRDYDVYSLLPEALHPRPRRARPPTPLSPEQERAVRERLAARRLAETRPTTGPAPSR